MFEWKQISADSEMAQPYQDQLQRSFPSLPLGQSVGRNYGIFNESELVGGFTLIENSLLNQDSDLDQHWQIQSSIQGTRLQRVWTKPSAPRKTLYWIFRALLESADPDQLLYGVVSLPLVYALTRSATFSHHLGYLVPRTPLESCHWDLNAAPSSEGKMLLKFYLDSGAQILGPPSGNENDRSVRLVIGLNLSQAALLKKERVYAQARR